MHQRVRVKICGITIAEDLHAAVDAGADAIGLNFHPPSPRCITSAQADELLHILPPFVQAIGVFVKKTHAELLPVLARLPRITGYQVHGSESEVVNAQPHYHIPAFQVRDEEDLARIHVYLADCQRANAVPAAILVDGHAPGLVGGTGQRAPWDLLAGFDPGVRLILAGGLTPENVAEAVARVRPWAVDVASGVESSPGKKDREKVRAFIAAVRS